MWDIFKWLGCCGDGSGNTITVLESGDGTAFELESAYGVAYMEELGSGQAIESETAQGASSPPEYGQGGANEIETGKGESQC